MKKALIIAALLFGTYNPNPPPMYCGHKRVIQTGYTAAQVETFCGPADEVLDYGYGYEEWIYYGVGIPGKYVTYTDFYLYFEHGILTNIERG